MSHHEEFDDAAHCRRLESIIADLRAQLQQAQGEVAALREALAHLNRNARCQTATTVLERTRAAAEAHDADVRRPLQEQIAALMNMLQEAAREDCCCPNHDGMANK